MTFRSIVFVLSIFLYSFSAIIDVKSGSKEDIQTAISRAAIGDIVRLPSGTYNFSGGITLKSGISIIGAGANRTILRRTTAGGAYGFTVDGSNGRPVRFSGFSMTGMAPQMSPGIKLINGCKDFRIDHITFTKCFDRAIEIHGTSYGVIDHNRFIDNSYTSVVVYGDANLSWNKPLTLGTKEAVYVEDNYFEQNSAVDPGMSHHIASNNGSKYVFRYNTIVDANMQSHCIDAHGNKFGSERGSRSYEIYKNNIKVIHRWAGINIRGGDGVIFGNTFTGDIVSPMHMMHEGKSGDGNCTYPCLDQIRKLYMWENTHNGKDLPIFNRHPSIIKEGRDYFRSPLPGYVPFTYPHPLIQDQFVTAAVNLLNNTMQNGIQISFRNYKNSPSLYIEFNGNTLQSKQLEYKLFNAKGSLVYKFSSISKVSDNLLVHQIQRPLAHGMYNLVVENDNKIITKAQIIL